MLKREYEMPDIPDISAVCRSELLFADYEMTDCFKLVKTLWDIMKRAKHRFDRKDTLQVSPSVSQFVELKRNETDFPYVLYDFRNNGDRICIFQKRKRFYVYANVSSPKVLNDYFHSCEVIPQVYGNFEQLCDCVRLWLDVVTRYCFEINKDFIPF